MYPKYKITTAPLIIKNIFWSTETELPPLSPKTTILELPEPIDMDSPEWFKSIEARDNALKIQRKIERQNAQALKLKEQELKKLYDAEEKRRKQLLHDKMIQYYAEQADEDGVPAEFEEEINAYRASHEGSQAKYDQSLQRLEEERRRKREKHQRRGYGWRAARLHEIIRPYKRQRLNPPPEEQVSEQQQTIDARQNEFKRNYEERYGKTPSHEITKEAMPDIAAPVGQTTCKLAQFLITPYKLT